jgi:hypothetical protein
MSDRRRQGMAACSGSVKAVTDRSKDKERRRRFSWNLERGKVEMKHEFKR